LKWSLIICAPACTVFGIWLGTRLNNAR
jgi:hypothetical protein